LAVNGLDDAADAREIAAKDMATAVIAKRNILVIAGWVPKVASSRSGILETF
jgi:hypothetical protein